MAGFSPEFIKALLLSGRSGARFLNDTAVQIDVWAAFAESADHPVDLLLTPHSSTRPAALARDLHLALAEFETSGTHEVVLAPLEGVVAAHINLDQFLGVILPSTAFDLASELADLEAAVQVSPTRADIGAEIMPSLADQIERPNALPSLYDLLRFAALADNETGAGLRTALGLLTEMSGRERRGFPPGVRQALVVALIWAARDWNLPDFGGMIDLRLTRGNDSSLIGELKERRLDSTALLAAADRAPHRKVWRVALNRKVYPLGTSIAAVKADAARRVFDIDCSDLAWAVIDSGIDGSHPAFRDHDAGGFATRIVGAYDFTLLRELIAFDRLANPARRNAMIDEVANRGKLEREQAQEWLEKLAADADDRRQYDWEILARLLETPSDRLPERNGQPVSGHGTHVAGVLAGDWREDDRAIFTGMCPNLKLYDLRVLGDSREATEFAVIAALEFVRWLNQRNRYIRIHGANLSIGLDHDVENFACGSTPVCLSCDATSAVGVSIVVAAGNQGFHDYITGGMGYSGYAQCSIADPGNARSAITVGATHRDRPHEYGVSFFSSRGPTGDGRMKPDLVAPGEKIDGPLPNLGLGRMDGTSMSAPHVSGIAAMLMAVHRELVGRPDRVKQAIVETATDLGRERIFQGAGLADALRALQSL